VEDETSVAGLSSRQLAVQREVETYLEQKADKLLSSLVGSGNARVQVAASINFDKVERTVQAVDPDKQALSVEQKAEVTPSTPQQGAGYSTTANTYENTKSVETFSGAIGNLKKLTVAVLVADKVTMPALPAAPAATDSAATDSATAAPAAAVVPQPIITARTPEELARIEALVRNALGVDSARGDMISVVSAPFDMPAPRVDTGDATAIPKDFVGRAQFILDKIQTNPKPVVALAALGVLLIVALTAVLMLRPKKPVVVDVPATPEALPGSPPYAELPASTQMQQAMEDMQALAEDAYEEQEELEEQRPAVRLPPLPTTPEREQAIATVEQRPEAALRVVRTWLRQ